MPLVLLRNSPSKFDPESIRIRIPLFSGSTSAFIWELGAAAEFLRFSEVSGSARSGMAGCDCTPVLPFSGDAGISALLE
ncbi:hypothetical protein L873DRAFT_1817975 [Choiromyces venosus 120613-1]|uniref:Uncharacterized protein n=1 Tax=Choiromyces venosus 120613-1 TaxID=1336337 RepID=A0A3N4J1Q2_9PEZI|nr:hypothetical protein L873DRAFT_1817975 [Choiromyces venosus 120613-1]